MCKIGESTLFTSCGLESKNIILLNLFVPHIMNTKINVFSSKFNYQEFAFQAPSNLPKINYNNTFILTSDLASIPIRKFSWNMA